MLCRVHKHLDFVVASYKYPFTEVPGHPQNLVWLSTIFKVLRVYSQVLEHRMGFWTIHVAFFHECELCFVSLLHYACDLLVCVRLLVLELITREANYFKFASKCLLYLLHL